MLDGRYPSEEFAELRPRLVWDRIEGTLRARRGSQKLAVTNAGTIPDRGLYGVHLPDGRRVGEFDEEMVYEARVGQAFRLGSTTWRIEDITRDRVIVTPAPEVPGAIPFWKGDGIGRTFELGAAVGAFQREVSEMPQQQALELLRGEYDLDEFAADNVYRYLNEQREATRAVPSDRTIVIERFRDEIGDWRLCVLTPFGGRVHAAWAMAVSARLRDERGLDAGRDLVGRRRDPAPARRRRPAACRTSRCSIPRSSRSWSPPSSATRRCSARASARRRRARC